MIGYPLPTTCCTKPCYFPITVRAHRWRSCVTYVSGNLGYVVGAMFVKRYFPEASKNDVSKYIHENNICHFIFL